MSSIFSIKPFLKFNICFPKVNKSPQLPKDTEVVVHSFIVGYLFRGLGWWEITNPPAGIWNLIGKEN